MRTDISGHLKETIFSISGRSANLGFVDGHIETITIPEQAHEVVKRSWIDSQAKDDDLIETPASTETAAGIAPPKRMKWGTVIGACSLLVISVLPAFFRASRTPSYTAAAQE